jgi:NADP-dependent 3-hydroxy acid dehydrogenase YdfG
MLTVFRLTCTFALASIQRLDSTLIINKGAWHDQQSVVHYRSIPWTRPHLAEAALKRGDRVTATARNVGDLAELRKRFGDAVLPLGLDVTESTQPQRVVQQAFAHFGRLDVLVNNAGSSLIATVEEANGDQIQDLFDANLFGMVRALIAALPLLRKQGSGHILGVSSSLGIVPMPLIGFYGGVDFGLSIFNNLRTINHEAWFDSHPRLPKAVSGAVFGTRNQSWSVSMHSEEADQ